MLNATWIAARPHWYLASIGKTNSVQPYCRLAIITMQTMPNASCSQRNDEGRAASARALIDMFSLQAFLTAVLHHRIRRLSPHIGIGLPRALNLKQRLYRLISPNFRTRFNVSKAIIGNATVTLIVTGKLTRGRALAIGFAWLTAGWLASAAFADDKP